MIEIYLRLVDLVLTPILVMLAIVLVLRGHDYPGGGFIAGLTVAAAIELSILARGPAVMQRRIGRFLLPLVGFGLLTAVFAALLGFYAGGFFKGIWLKFDVAGLEIKIGTPQLFDLGVMFVVIGMTITYLIHLSETGAAKKAALQATAQATLPANAEEERP
jgi:multicomponent Na+:H+ antiporter subunit B